MKVYRMIIPASLALGFVLAQTPPARLAGLLTGWSDRPVVDMTGLPGRYDLSFPVVDEELHALVARAFLNGGGSLPAEMIQQLDSLDLTSLHAGGLMRAGARGAQIAAAGPGGGFASKVAN